MKDEQDCTRKDPLPLWHTADWGLQSAEHGSYIGTMPGDARRKEERIIHGVLKLLALKDIRTASVNSGLPIDTSVILGKYFNFSVPWFPRDCRKCFIR